MNWVKAVKLATITEERDKDISLVRKINTKCFRCGKTNLSFDKCKYGNYSCSNFKKIGHLKVMCKSSSINKTQDSSYKSKFIDKSKRNVNIIEINYVSKSASEPIMTTLKVNGKVIEFYIDSDAAVTIIPKKYAHHFNNVQWGDTSTMVRSACRNLEPALGTAEYNVKGKILHVLILGKGFNTPLLRRDCLVALNYNWRTMIKDFSGTINVNSVEEVSVRLENEFFLKFKNTFSSNSD